MAFLVLGFFFLLFLICSFLLSLFVCVARLILRFVLVFSCSSTAEPFLGDGVIDGCCRQDLRRNFRITPEKKPSRAIIHRRQCYHLLDLRKNDSKQEQNAELGERRRQTTKEGTNKSRKGGRINRGRGKPP